jgi:hypothetical protein
MDLLAYYYVNSKVFEIHQLILILVPFDGEDNHHDDFVFLINIFQDVQENIVSNSIKKKIKNLIFHNE